MDVSKGKDIGHVKANVIGHVGSGIRLGDSLEVFEVTVEHLLKFLIIWAQALTRACFVLQFFIFCRYSGLVRGFRGNCWRVKNGGTCVPTHVPCRSPFSLTLQYGSWGYWGRLWTLLGRSVLGIWWSRKHSNNFAFGHRGVWRKKGRSRGDLSYVHLLPIF